MSSRAWAVGETTGLTPSKCRDVPIGENKPNSISAAVGHNNIAVRHDCNTIWAVELSSHAGPIGEAICATPSKRRDGPIGGHKPNSVIVGVGNDDNIIRLDCNTTWTGELSSCARPIGEASCATPSKRRDGPIGGYKPNSVIVCVGNNDNVVRLDGNTLRSFEAGSRANTVGEAICATSKRRDGPIGSYKPNSVIGGVGNDDNAVRLDCDVVWIAEIGSRAGPIGEATCATPSKRRDGPIGGYKPNSVIDGVGNDDNVVRLDCNTTWCVELGSRARPIGEATCATSSKRRDGAVCRRTCCHQSNKQQRGTERRCVCRRVLCWEALSVVTSCFCKLRLHEDVK